MAGFVTLANGRFSAVHRGLFDGKIDSETYERQRDLLREEIAMARIELDDARLEQIDVEGLLGFVEHALDNAARLWIDASPANRERLQWALFPQGIPLQDGKRGTAVSCFAFTQLTEFVRNEFGVASLSIPSWNQIETFLRQMSRLRESAGSAA
jgi:hypothetical protein